MIRRRVYNRYISQRLRLLSRQIRVRSGNEWTALGWRFLMISSAADGTMIDARTDPVKLYKSFDPFCKKFSAVLHAILQLRSPSYRLRSISPFFWQTFSARPEPQHIASRDAQSRFSVTTSGGAFSVTFITNSRCNLKKKITSNGTLLGSVINPRRDGCCSFFLIIILARHPKLDSKFY